MTQETRPEAWFEGLLQLCYDQPPPVSETLLLSGRAALLLDISRE
jgi:hypothetical protein